MILQLLGALLLTTCISSGAVHNSETATNFNNVEQHSKKKTKETETLDEQITLANSNYTNYRAIDPANNYHEYWEKMNITANTNNYTIKGNVYTDVIGITNNYEQYGYRYNFVNADHPENLSTESLKRLPTRLFYILEITPHVYTIEQETKISFTIDFTGTADYPNYSYIIKTWKGTNSSLTQYFNAQNTFTAYYNYYLEQALNNNFFLDYEETTGPTIESTTNPNEHTLIYQNINNLSFVYSNTLYLFVEIIPTIKPLNNTQAPIIEVQPKTTGNPTETPNARIFNNIQGGIEVEFTIPPTTTGEVVDIPGLMFDILTMPFAFISQAFNLTLFPGTNYQINIANIFLCIIGIMIFVTILNILVKR